MGEVLGPAAVAPLLTRLPVILTLGGPRFKEVRMCASSKISFVLCVCAFDSISFVCMHKMKGEAVSGWTVQVSGGAAGWVVCGTVQRDWGID